jgi:phosphoribosylamine--glycine ligase
VPLDVADHSAVVSFCRKAEIDLVVVGPEAPLVAGIVDDLSAAGFKAFGPGKAAAQLEGSKHYTKALCAEADIPTAAWRAFGAFDAAAAYVRSVGAPIVIKADGLAAGKGVTVAATVDEALDAVAACLAMPGAEVVIEKCLTGEEASFFALTDGVTAIPFGTAQDHKRAGDGDTGPNTGGMGAYSPAPVLSDALAEQVMSEIIRPTLATMARRGAPFRGVLFAGLMLTADGPRLIEYNVRFGDPECQALMMRLDSDLLPLMVAIAEGRLAEKEPPRWRDDYALCVVMAARGYPGSYLRGEAIRGVDAAEAAGAVVFQAGTALHDGELVSAGGRVLGVTATAPTIADARSRAYAAVDKIDWPGGFFRRDIGRRAV